MTARLAPTQPDCFIGVDLGTSGCRAIAIDARGNPLAEARRALPASQHPSPGASEQDPADWWQAVASVLADLAQQTIGRPRALSVDGTSSTLLLCDVAGRPCSPALMYDDRRATAQAAHVATLSPVDSPAQGPGSALAKLLYLCDCGYAEEAAHALHQADWVAGRLSGRFGLADENNVLKLGYDPERRRWPDWLATTGLPVALLPRVCPVGTALGRIDPTVATDLGLPPDLLIVAGTTDSNAATLAAGITKPGEAVTSLGSTLVLKVLAEHPVVATRYGVYSHRIGDAWLAGGASNSGGAALRQYFDDASLARLSREIDPQRSPGLDFYPLPAVGERFPFSDPSMPPRLEPRPVSDQDFLHGLLDGIAGIEAEGYRRLAELGAPYPLRVFTSGGGAVNETWRAIRQRHLGVPVLRAQQTQAAFGTARLAHAAYRQVADAGTASPSR